MAKLGREWELFIASIERHLSRGGTVVRTPEKVWDPVGGDYRDVDITVRSADGSAKLLVAIECRDRKRRADVRWIEELVTKGKDIGAEKVVVVSRKGLSATAQRKAAAYGIEIRSVEEVTEDVLASWLTTDGEWRGPGAAIRKVESKLEHFELCDRFGRIIPGHFGWVKPGSRFSTETKIVLKNTGESVSLGELIQEVVDSKIPKIHPAPPPLVVFQRNLESLHLSARVGQRSVKVGSIRFIMSLKLVTHVLRGELVEAHVYTTADKTLAKRKVYRFGDLRQHGVEMTVVGFDPNPQGEDLK